MPGTRKLGKTTDQRTAMLRQQVTDFLDKGKMETTITAPMDGIVSEIHVKAGQRIESGDLLMVIE